MGDTFSRTLQVANETHRRKTWFSGDHGGKHADVNAPWGQFLPLLHSDMHIWMHHTWIVGHLWHIARVGSWGCFPGTCYTAHWFKHVDMCSSICDMSRRQQRQCLGWAGDIKDLDWGDLCSNIPFRYTAEYHTARNDYCFHAFRLHKAIPLATAGNTMQTNCLRPQTVYKFAVHIPKPKVTKAFPIARILFFLARLSVLLIVMWSTIAYELSAKTWQMMFLTFRLFWLLNLLLNN